MPALVGVSNSQGSTKLVEMELRLAPNSQLKFRFWPLPRKFGTIMDIVPTSPSNPLYPAPAFAVPVGFSRTVKVTSTSPFGRGCSAG